MSQGGGSRASLVGAYATTLKALKSWKDAEQVSVFGLSIFPGQSVFPLQYGEVLFEQGRLHESESMFHKALAVAPETTDAYYGLGRIALERGQREEAIRQFKRALHYSPYHREALQLLDRMQREDRSNANDST
jgi:tetratricopeptide (TPR) repeat protein